MTKGLWKEMWWVELGWMPGAHQTALSLHFLNRSRGENTTKSSEAKIRTGTSLSNYCHGRNRLNLGKLV